MRLLLDTHVILWRMTDDPRMSSKAARIIDEEAASVCVSSISIWEVAVKWAIRKRRPGDMPVSGQEFLRALKRAQLEILSVLPGHAAAVDDLPEHHGDPFDRFLVATARHEGMVLLTHDAALSAYGDCVLVV